MGKATKKRLDAKKRLLFETCGDARSPEERAHARAMLDTLQQKLEDDALREDGFYFLDSKYVAARRPRTTSGMKMRSYDGHVRSVTAVVLVRCDTWQSGEQSREQEDVLSFVFTFGLDIIGIWDFKTTELVASLDVSSHDARSICGAVVMGAAFSKERDVALPQRILFAFATDSAPVLHTFDPTSRTISVPSNQHNQDSGSTRSSNSRWAPTGYFCAAHQQQITSMTFSHNARVLATCSWDSTCMLWRVHEEKEAATLESPPAVAASILTLVLVQILPVHELGASFASFTLDDQQLITTGECTVKLWDVSEETSETPNQNLEGDIQQSENCGQFEKVRADWEAAIPFSFSVTKSMDLLALDEALTELVPNHEWQHRSRDYGRVLRLLSPEQEPFAQRGSHEAESRKSIVSDGTPPEELVPAAALTHDPAKSLQPLTEVLRDPIATSNQEERRVVDHLTPEPKKHKEADPGTHLEDVIPATTPETFNNILSLEDAEYLEMYYRDLTIFDFEQLLNPTLPLCMPNNYESKGSTPTSSIESDKENQRKNKEYTASELKTSPITLHELVWSPLQPNANGKLLKTFSEYTSQGVFSAHTSKITCCAVSKELDLVVTVALDKMLKFWSLESCQVLETVREAHSSQIICCALTTKRTLQNPDGVLVATGGKDNLVKVWRRNNNNNNVGALDQPHIECIYSFSGHYDALTSCVFDQMGVFLITTGDDTNVIAWRVVPSNPDQPKALRLVSVDKFAITVSWDEPLANGSPLVHYVIRATQVSSLVVGRYDLLLALDVNVPAKYTSKVVENLQPGIQYTLQIAAVNAIGSSPFSDLTPPIETLAFVPSRIENPLQYSDRQATRLRLSWKQPSPNGALIQSFTIRCLPENSVFVPVLELSIPIAELETIASLSSGTVDDKVNLKKKKTATTAKQRLSAASKRSATSTSSSVSATTIAPAPPADVFYSYVVEGLWAGEIYQFVAAAENQCGLATFSRVGDCVKMDPTAPDPPSQPLIVNIQKRQADVVWEKPKCNGSEILQYTLEWIQDDSVSQDLAFAADVDETQDPEPLLTRNSVVLLTRSIPGTSYTLQGLEPGKPLRVWLSASNLIDNKLCTSEISPASGIAITLCDVPDKPARPKLMQPSAHTLVLAFAPPKCNGLEIQSYDVMMNFEEVQFGITNCQVYREFKLQAADCQAQQMGSNGLCMSTFTIQKLRGKTYYSAKLCAINALGVSHMSECSALVRTKPPTIPARMLEPPTVLDVEPTRASISWGAPEHDGGAPLVAFHLQYSAQPTSSTIESDDESGYKALFDQEVTIFQGQELLATFLKPKTTYRFRVASSNGVGKAPFSKKSVAVHTPSLVEFTISRYFADRPEVEHVKARFIQKRYRAWKSAVARRKCNMDALRVALRDWHIL